MPCNDCSREDSCPPCVPMVDFYFERLNELRLWALHQYQVPVDTNHLAPGDEFVVRYQDGDPVGLMGHEMWRTPGAVVRLVESELGLVRAVRGRRASVSEEVIVAMIQSYRHHPHFDSEWLLS